MIFLNHNPLTKPPASPLTFFNKITPPTLKVTLYTERYVKSNKKRPKRNI